ncbi:hypothetical protein D3C75_840190 [compost metagenome]
MEAAFLRRRNQFAGALAINHVHFIVADVCFQGTRQLLTFGFWHGDIVFDIHRIQHLATKTFAHQAGTDTFTCGVNRCRRTRRAGSDNQHIVCFTFVQLGCRAFFCAAVHFGDDLSQRHTTLTKLFTVHKYRRNAHHVTIGDFVLEHAAVNRGVFDARVQYRHQVQRLHHVRAVVAGERIIGFKLKITVEVTDLLQQRLRLF